MEEEWEEGQREKGTILLDRGRETEYTLKPSTELSILSLSSSAFYFLFFLLKEITDDMSRL